MRTFTSMITAILISSGAYTASASTQTCGDALLSVSGGALYSELRVTALQRSHLQTIRIETNNHRQWLESELARVRRALRRPAHAPLPAARVRRLRQQEASLIRRLSRQSARAASRVVAVLTPWQRRTCSRPGFVFAQRSRVMREAPQPVVSRTPPQRIVREAPPRWKAKVRVTRPAPARPQPASTRRAPPSGPTQSCAHKAPAAKRSAHQAPAKSDGHGGRRS